MRHGADDDFRRFQASRHRDIEASGYDTALRWSMSDGWSRPWPVDGAQLTFNVRCARGICGVAKPVQGSWCSRDNHPSPDFAPGGTRQG